MHQRRDVNFFTGLIISKSIDIDCEVILGWGRYRENAHDVRKLVITKPVVHTILLLITLVPKDKCNGDSRLGTMPNM
jgi:hypothetical protein